MNIKTQSNAYEGDRLLFLDNGLNDFNSDFCKASQLRLK